MVKSSVLAFSDGTGGPLADMWRAWSQFVSPVGELYSFLTPPAFTVLIVAATAGFIYLIRETSASRRQGLETHSPRLRPITQRRNLPIIIPANSAAAETIRAGLISGEQFDCLGGHNSREAFTLCAGLTRPLVVSTPSRLAAFRCQPDLNFHLDRVQA
jgi:hypothetical protein